MERLVVYKLDSGAWTWKIVSDDNHKRKWKPVAHSEFQYGLARLARIEGKEVLKARHAS